MAHNKNNNNNAGSGGNKKTTGSYHNDDELRSCYRILSKVGLEERTRDHGRQGVLACNKGEGEFPKPLQMPPRSPLCRVHRVFSLDSFLCSATSPRESSLTLAGVHALALWAYTRTYFPTQCCQCAWRLPQGRGNSLRVQLPSVSPVWLCTWIFFFF